MNRIDPSVELAEYVADLFATVQFMINGPVPSAQLTQWLTPMLRDEDQRAMLLHEEPFYLAADFLGLDRSSPEYRKFEERYFQFRASVLQRAPMKHPSRP